MRGNDIKRAKKVANEIVGFKWLPLTDEKQMMKIDSRNQLVIPPTNGPRKAAVPYIPAAVGGSGGTKGECADIHIVMNESIIVPGARSETIKELRRII
jgi:hypothetical protein